MRSAFAAAALLSAVQYANAQTFTDCNPLQKTCPSDPGLGSTLTTDFTKGASNFWTLADATKMSYDSNGANFVIKTATDAPTISASKYIMFGKVTVTTKAAPGTGIVSSFILESDDLDEIDWEWLGSTDSSVESNFFGKGNTTSYDRAIYHPVADPIGNWHTYTIDWTAQSIKWYIDGALVRTLAYGDRLSVYGQNYPQTPMKVKLGNWVGCANAAAASNPDTEGTCSWAGGPVNFAQAPFTMYVKSVVIEDYGCGTSYTYGDHSGSYQSIKASGGCSGGSSITGGDSSSSDSSTTSAPTTTKSSASKTTTAAQQTTAASSTPSSGSNSTVASTGGATQATTTTGPPLPSHNAAAGLQRSMGLLDYAVVVLGLGLGALVM
jgi:beta-glucanase (GH16 family)